MDNNSNTNFETKINMSKELSESLDNLSLELSKDKGTVEREVGERQKQCYETSVMRSSEEDLLCDKEKEHFVGTFN